MSDQPLRPVGIGPEFRPRSHSLWRPARGRVYIVKVPRRGETILANQACFHHASEGGRSVYITLLAESHSRMFGHLRRMAFFDESKFPGFVHYVGGFSTLESEGLAGLLTLVRGIVTKKSAGLAIIDGLVSAHESSRRTGTSRNSSMSFRCLRI